MVASSIGQANNDAVNPKFSLHQRLNPPRERFIPNPKLKFMEQCREVMRFRRLALRSEEAYWQWIKRFIFFHDKRHPRELLRLHAIVLLSQPRVRDNG